MRLSGVFVVLFFVGFAAGRVQAAGASVCHEHNQFMASAGSWNHKQSHGVQANILPVNNTFDGLCSGPEDGGTAHFTFGQRIDYAEIGWYDNGTVNFFTEVVINDQFRNCNGDCDFSSGCASYSTRTSFRIVYLGTGNWGMKYACNGGDYNFAPKGGKTGKTGYVNGIGEVEEFRFGINTSADQTYQKTWIKTGGDVWVTWSSAGADPICDYDYNNDLGNRNFGGISTDYWASITWLTAGYSPYIC